MSQLTKFQIILGIWAWLWIVIAWIAREWILLVIALTPYIAMSLCGRFFSPEKGSTKHDGTNQ
jgi:hypothetical protein